MTDKEINEAIAEVCGITKIATKEGKFVAWSTPDGPDNDHWSRMPPDYCHDLNAMHEAENCLVGLGNGENPLYDTYIFLLGGLIYGKLPDHLKQKCHDLEVFKDWLSVNADAKDKATAFLMTLDKWKES